MLLGKKEDEGKYNDRIGVALEAPDLLVKRVNIQALEHLLYVPLVVRENVANLFHFVLNRSCTEIAATIRRAAKALLLSDTKALKLIVEGNLRSLKRGL
jgi:hypothetical protein